MKSAVETLNPTRVKLTVEVTYEELAPSVDAAYKTISSQVSIPGFRKGKVPPRIIDQRLGRGAVLEEAVNNALPGFYAKAVEESDVRPMGRPDVEVTDVPEGVGGDLKFTVEVDVRPEITLPDLESIEVEVDDVEVGDSDIAERLETLRERFGTLLPIERPAVDGDYVTLDLAATVGDTEVDSVKGISYQVGSGTMLEGMDEALTGLSADETTTFDAPLAGGDFAGQQAHVALTLQAVKERQLPELDDDFAQLASEFDTLDELRESLRADVEKHKRLEQAMQARERLVEVLLERLDIPVPEAVIAEEVHRHLENESRLEDDEHRTEVEEETRQGLRAQILLDALAEAEQVSVGQRELVDYLVGSAQQYGVDPNRFVSMVNEANQMPVMVGEVARRKALAATLTKVTVKDASGSVIDIDGFLTALAAEEAAGEDEHLEEPDDQAEHVDVAIESVEEQDDEGEAAGPAPSVVVGAAADPSAISVSSVGGFIPDEPTS